MISRFPLKLLLSPHADAQLKQYQLCPACSHKAATDLVPLHPKVGVYMLRPPKTDTYMASVVAKFFYCFSSVQEEGLFFGAIKKSSSETNTNCLDSKRSRGGSCSRP